MPFLKYDRDICSRLLLVCVYHYHLNVHKVYCQYKQFFICSMQNSLSVSYAAYFDTETFCFYDLYVREKYMTTCNSNIVYLNFLKTFRIVRTIL